MNLANKYRPNCWQEVVGQPAVISILQRQVATKSWKNCYLFCGSHGCGKTTVARIFAKEINEGLGEPIEIDGATNNGVENIRNIIADAQRAPFDCKYKVYIIDECHMITKAGWNAALKIIEEPPTGTVFIFCTTDAKKIPSTIMSRVQRFDFNKIGTSVIENRLEYILNENDIDTYEKEALNRIAYLSGGHMRDAIQMLDKYLSWSTDITLKNAEAMFGVVPNEIFTNILCGVVEKDLIKCLTEYEELFNRSSSMLSSLDQVIEFFVNCVIYNRVGKCDCVYLPTDAEEISKKNGKLVKQFMNRLLEVRKFANEDTAGTLLKTVILEMCGGLNGC